MRGKRPCHEKYRLGAGFTGGFLKDMTQSSTSNRVGFEEHQWRGAGHSGGNHHLCQGREVGNYGACTGNSQYLAGLNCSLLEGRDVGSKL